MSLEIPVEGQLAHKVLAEWMELYDVRTTPSLSWSEYLTAVLVPIAEELLFRGLSV